MELSARMDTILDSLRAFIESELLSDGRNEPLEPRDDLLREGILDSIAVLQIVNFMEQTYGIRIENREINLDNFKDLASMTQLVELKSKAAEP